LLKINWRRWKCVRPHGWTFVRCMDQCRRCDGPPRGTRLTTTKSLAVEIAHRRCPSSLTPKRFNVSELSRRLRCTKFGAVTTVKRRSPAAQLRVATTMGRVAGNVPPPLRQKAESSPAVIGSLQDAAKGCIPFGSAEGSPWRAMRGLAAVSDCLRRGKPSGTCAEQA
jgi:hypothetical protein